MKKIVAVFILTSFIFFSCEQKNKQANVLVRKVDMGMLDSVIKKSDTTYSKPYKRTDLVTAFYYLDRKNKVVCQLMKDSSETIRQIIIAKNNVRTFFAQYYANGQLMATLPLDEYGQYHGPSAYYYNDGVIQNEGDYLHGMYTRKWNNYNEDGELTSVYEYGPDGNRIK